jgi:hypothetical protein
MSSATFSWLSSASAPTLASRPLLRRLVVGAESEAARRVARPIAADEAEHTRVRGRGLVLLRIGRSLRGLHQLRGQYRGLRWTDKLWPKDGYRSRAPSLLPPSLCSGTTQTTKAGPRLAWLNDELFACAMQRHDSNDEGWPKAGQDMDMDMDRSPAIDDRSGHPWVRSRPRACRRSRQAPRSPPPPSL